MSTSQRISRFRNPSNGYEENVGEAWLWCLLAGPIYFAAKYLVSCRCLAAAGDWDGRHLMVRLSIFCELNRAEALSP